MKSNDYRAWFQCISECNTRYNLDEIIYSCPECGNLLEVRHDIDRLKSKSASEWKALFDRRYRRSEWPYGSSVWGKKEVVCPDVDVENVVSAYEGGSNLFWAERLGKEIGAEKIGRASCRERV